MSTDLSITRLRNFLLVAQQGSFQSAAGKACRSQPAMTKSIQSLEVLLGEQLFEPSQRTTLTPFGQACLPLASELTLHYDRAVNAMLAIAAKKTGSVTMAAIGSLATHWMPQLVEGFMHDHPDVSIRLFDDNSENIQRMVLSGEVDFGLCSPVSHEPQLAFTPLVQDRFGLVCHTSHQLAARPSVKWAALKGLPLIGTTAHRQIDSTLESAHFNNCKFYAGNMLTLIAMLQQGVGVTVLAELAVPPHVKNLAFVPLVAPQRSRRAGIMQLKGRTLSPAAAILVERLLILAKRYKIKSGLSEF